MWRVAQILFLVFSLAEMLFASDDLSLHSTTIRDGEISISIPENWIEIEPEFLEELTTWAAGATAGRLVEVYQHGFRPDDDEADPLLPAVFVQVRESGRLRYGTFLHLPRLDEFQNDTKRTFPTGLPPLILGIAVDDVAFDTSRYCLRLEHSLDLRVKGRITILTAAFLSERGFVTIRYADRERQIAEGRELFERIIDSVKLAPEIAYRPRITDRWPGFPFFVAGALVAAALTAFLIHRRRSQT